MSLFNPDYGCKTVGCSGWSHPLLGVAPFADANHLIWRIGLEGEARWLNWLGPGGGLKESNYLVGPRYPVYAGRRLSANVKFLAGGAFLDNGRESGGWAAFVPGATVGYRLSPRLMVRGDYEYQMWPGFVNSRGQVHGLTPDGYSIGVSYRLFR